jgi:hypothetical protein
MNTDRRNARWAGVFYIMATAAPILTVPFIGYLGGGVSGEPVADYLARLSTSGTQVSIGALIEVVWALVVVGIVVTLLPILRRHNEALALGFSGLRFMEALSTVIHCIVLLSLFTLSEEYVAAGMPGASYHQGVGDLLLAAREWTFFIGSGLVWSLSAVILNTLLYQGRLMPRWLSVWGLLGGALSLANYVPEFFGAAAIDPLFYPIALQEMVFAVWLIVKGLRPSADAAGRTGEIQP